MLAFIPGLCETPDIWQPTIERLHISQGERLTFDLPGHLPSTPSVSVDQWLADCAACLERQHPGRKTILVCHSTGGLLGLMLAKRVPQVVSGLVLVGSLTAGHRDRAITFDFSKFSGSRAGELLLGGAWRSWLGTRTAFEMALRMVTTKAVARSIPDKMRQTLLACDPNNIAALVKWLLSVDIADTVKDIKVPMLVIIGQRDNVVPPAHQLQIAENAPNAQAFIMDTGHLAFLEAPESFDLHFLSWLHTQLPPQSDDSLAAHSLYGKPYT